MSDLFDNDIDDDALMAALIGLESIPNSQLPTDAMPPHQPPPQPSAQQAPLQPNAGSRSNGTASATARTSQRTHW